ncbi:hypothetical protein NPIL_574641 [Nephila pilipes]|uniref:Uncharacterized protein n=1 Tax=Nephila pilipes TaxID=299642 RepID=A0A8X6MNB6_NEPPI|nr:hypothetical protein NPIL_574641 [Nephila pilipes]
MLEALGHCWQGVVCSLQQHSALMVRAQISLQEIVRHGGDSSSEETVRSHKTSCLVKTEGILRPPCVILAIYWSHCVPNDNKSYHATRKGKFLSITMSVLGA